MLSELEFKNFTIISNNCFGGYIYQKLGMQYTSPFVGLFLYAEDYYKLTKDLRYYISQELIMEESLVFFEPGNYYYPVGLLGDIKVHFLHYKTPEEALEKWNRRKTRINFDNIYFKFDNRDGATEELLLKIEELPYKNKIIFVNKQYENLSDLVYIPNQEHLDAVWLDYNTFEYFDPINWLNKGGNQL